MDGEKDGYIDVKRDDYMDRGVDASFDEWMDRCNNKKLNVLIHIVSFY